MIFPKGAYGLLRNTQNNVIKRPNVINDAGEVLFLVRAEGESGCLMAWRVEEGFIK